MKTILIKKNSKLKSKLFEIGMTQKELAKSVHIPEPYVSLILAGRYNPDNEERQKIAEAVGCSPADIFNH